MSLLLLLALSASAAQAEEAGSREDPIIVIGERIQQSKAKLKACLARDCPPDEDIDATLELAEYQVEAGEYHDARKTLLRSIDRNEDEAEKYPEPVSDLWRANGKVAANLGLDRSYYYSTVNILRALKAGIPEKDYRYFTARMEIAAMVARLKGHDRARLAYEDLAEDARSAGRRDIAAIAELKSAVSHLPPGDLQDRRINRIAQSTDPMEHTAMLQAKLVLAQFAYRDNDMGKFNTILKEFADLKLNQPLLIYSPPYKFAAAEVDQGSEMVGVQEAIPPALGAPSVDGGGVSGVTGTGLTPSSGGPVTRGNRVLSGLSTMTRRLTGNFEDRWIDVTFRVQPDGRVGDVELTRSDGDIFWADELLESIKGRIYTPIPADSPAAMRKERYTYTAGYERLTTGTRTATRQPRPRVEYIDLTPSVENALVKGSR
jgi:tetratricopeptide (TPR) repeat protein